MPKHYKTPLLDDSSSLKLKLTQQSIDYYMQGRFGQGYVGTVDIQSGEIHLLPAYNKDDGLARSDKDDKPFKQSVESIQKLGKNTGDLHTKALSVLALGHKGGARGRVLGFGIFKGYDDYIMQFRNRSASQNFFSIKYEPEFIQFYERYTDLSALNLKRSIPFDIFNTVYRAITQALNIPSSMSVMNSPSMDKDALENFRIEQIYLNSLALRQYLNENNLEAIDMVTINGGTPLSIAMQSADVSLINDCCQAYKKQLGSEWLKQLVKPSSPGGPTALDLFFQQKYFDSELAAELLLELDEKLIIDEILCSKDIKGQSIVSRAIDSKSSLPTDFLLTFLSQEQQFDMLSQIDDNGETRLHRAIADKDYEMVRFLLQRAQEFGFSEQLIMQLDITGSNPLHLVALMSDIELLEAFCENLSEEAFLKIIQQAENGNMSPWDIAIEIGNSEFCELILSTQTSLESKLQLMRRASTLENRAALFSYQEADETPNAEPDKPRQLPASPYQILAHGKLSLLSQTQKNVSAVVHEDTHQVRPM